MMLLQKLIQGVPENKPKGLKVAKEDQRSIGLMVNRLNGKYTQWLIGSMVDRLDG